MKVPTLRNKRGFCSESEAFALSLVARLFESRGLKGNGFGLSLIRVNGLAPLPVVGLNYTCIWILVGLPVSLVVSVGGGGGNLPSNREPKTHETLKPTQNSQSHFSGLSMHRRAKNPHQTLIGMSSKRAQDRHQHIMNLTVFFGLL